LNLNEPCLIVCKIVLIVFSKYNGPQGFEKKHICWVGKNLKKSKLVVGEFFFELESDIYFQSKSSHSHILKRYFLFNHDLLNYIHLIKPASSPLPYSYCSHYTFIRFVLRKLETIECDVSHILQYLIGSSILKFYNKSPPST
jgi:hypothetical protein